MPPRTGGFPLRPAPLPIGLLLLAALLPGHAARAQPAFDCNRATTAIERTICASPALSALDRELNAAYLRIGGDPGVAADQRAWLTRRNRDCAVPVDRAGREECLASAYAQRLAELRGGK